MPGSPAYAAIAQGNAPGPQANAFQARGAPAGPPAANLFRFGNAPVGQVVRGPDVAMAFGNEVARGPGPVRGPSVNPNYQPGWAPKGTGPGGRGRRSLKRRLTKRGGRKRKQTRRTRA
jgi:hypothetical protein